MYFYLIQHIIYPINQHCTRIVLFRKTILSYFVFYCCYSHDFVVWPSFSVLVTTQRGSSPVIASRQNDLIKRYFGIYLVITLKCILSIYSPWTII